MSQSSGTETTQPLGTTSARLVAVRLKSANKHIFRALLSLASVNLLIRIMGLFNQIVVTALFGQGAAMDAYYAAWTLPNTLAQLLASGLEASVIPVYSGVHAKATPEHSSRLFSTLLNLLLLGLIPFTILMIVFRHQMIIFAAPGLHESSMQLSIDLAPFIFPMLLFMTLNSFMEYLLNTKGQFGWPAYAGILVPLTTVTCILLAGRQFGVVMLAIGTLGGQVLQLIAILYRAHRAKFVYRPVLDLRLPELAAIGLVAWPALFGALIGQASPLVDQIFSSTLAVGSIAVLTNANKLLSVPVGVIFSSVGRAVLPFLSSQAAMKDMKAFKETLRLYLWAVGIGTVGLTAFMIVMAHPMVQILFQHGAFSAEDTDRTATTLVGFVIGLTPMAFGFITSRAFSALGKTKILMYISIFSVFANAGFDYIFGKMWGSFGIALATSAVYFCTMFILLFTLRRLIGKLYLFTPPREVLTVLWRLGLGQYYVRWVIWKEENLTTLHIPYDLSKRLVRLITALVIFGVGIAATIINTTYALTIAFGSLVVLAFMRYRYALLLTWVAVNALIGSTIPLFNGNHFLSGLTVPTLLLMLVVPIKPAFKRMPALPLLFAYLIWIFLSIGISAIGVGAFLIQWTIYLDYVAVAVLVIQLLRTRKLMMGLIDAILLQALFVSLYGIYGYFTKQNGLYDADITSLYRIGSVFAAPPTLAFFLSMIIPLSFYRIFTLKGFLRIVCIVFTLIFLAALGLTFTRGALISVPLSLILMIFFLPSRKLKIAMLSSIAGVGAIAMLAATIFDLPLFNRFLANDITTLNGRTYLWSALLNHFDPTHLLGYGLNASDVLLTQLQVGFGRGVIGTAPHNVFIGTLYDQGVIGLILIILVFIAIPWTLISRMRKANPEHRLILAMALAAFINIFVQSLEVTVMWSQPIGVYVWMIMALPFVAYWGIPKGSADRKEAHDTTMPGQTETGQRAKEEQFSHV